MTDNSCHRPHAPGWQSALEQAREAPRCGAKTRAGTPCRAPAVSGRPRCRMHGCGRGAGGPSGPRNGRYWHGNNTAEARAARVAFRSLLRRLKASVGSNK